MKNKIKFVLRHVFLLILTAFWLMPVVWLFVTTFSTEKGINTNHFFPRHWTLSNYHQLFFEPDTAANFPAWFRNSMIIAIFTCIISSAFVIMAAYAFSYLQFKARKGLMSFSIILGMFPGVLSMIAMYFVLKLLGLTDSIVGLIIVYSAGSGLGYMILKGFFDTIPESLREAARLEGASEATIFLRIVVPLSKSMIVYTIINAFLTPWMDFFMARLMIKSKNPSDWTMGIGLYNLLQRALVNQYFTIFCCGGLMVAVPIAGLFIYMQKFYVEGLTEGAVKG
jgi:arabinogalactan oligomer/maltooligosaccharide transport system permease protein